MTHRLQTVLLLLGAIACACAGCQPDSPEQRSRASSLGRRSDSAVSDPFGYHPDFSDMDVSGGDTATLDKQGMKRDLDNVLNP